MSATKQKLVNPSQKTPFMCPDNWCSLYWLVLSLRFFFSCLKFDLTKQQNDFKITLKTLEDNLLSRLSSASGNFLSDTELVENLETTKRTAAEIEEKVFVFY